MRGIILCGGQAKRLEPLTLVLNKHLLPVYSKPMVFYPIETLIKAGIKDIAIVLGDKDPGKFIEVLDNGKHFGLSKLTFLYQKESKGIADALFLAEEFAGGDSLAVILGDNTTDADISKEVNEFEYYHGTHLFLKEVEDPERFGVPKFKDSKITEVIEKPRIPPSNFAITGIYLFDNRVFNFIRKCSPSARGEMEITDVINFYIKEDNCQYSMLAGFWKDLGRPESLLMAGNYWFEKSKEK